MEQVDQAKLGGRQHFQSKSPLLQNLGQDQLCTLLFGFVHQEGQLHIDQEQIPWRPDVRQLDNRSYSIRVT